MANTVMGPETETVDPDWLIDWSMAYNHGGLNSQYIYNVREDSTAETCGCADAASSKTAPGTSRYIGPTTKVDLYDEDGKFTGSSYVEIG